VPLRLADTHAHLADPALYPVVDQVITRASMEGVERILAVGIDIASSALSVALAARFPTVWAAVGIHPHEASHFGTSQLAELRRLASAPRVVAIGEIGLDYYRDLAPRDAQQAAFAAQLDLAGELGLPVVVHNREADDDVLHLLRCRYRGNDRRRAGVLHCFSGDLKLAREAMQIGFFISFAGNITFRSAAALRAVAAAIPGDYLLIETDSPYLAPIPRRGRTNEPAYVRYVAEHLAVIRGMTVDALAAQTTANAAALFGWDSVTGLTPA
jgi:TatD DNase family protein